MKKNVVTKNGNSVEAVSDDEKANILGLQKNDKAFKDVESKIAELKTKLAESDFKVLPDYDEENTEIKKQRKLWRKELRKLEG